VKDTLFNLALAALIAVCVFTLLFAPWNSILRNLSGNGAASSMPTNKAYTHSIDIQAEYDAAHLLITNRSDCTLVSCQIVFRVKFDNPRGEYEGKRHLQNWQKGETVEIAVIPPRGGTFMSAQIEFEALSNDQVDQISETVHIPQKK
jgi:hypothetical protein